MCDVTRYFSYGTQLMTTPVPKRYSEKITVHISQSKGVQDTVVYFQKVPVESDHSYQSQNDESAVVS